MYAFFDGDGIGNLVELLLIENRIEEAKEFSESLMNALKSVVDYLNDETDIEIIIAGGDDLLIVTENGKIPKKLLNKIRNIFKKSNSQNATMSCGIGNSIQEAIFNLERAKLLGKDRIHSSIQIK